MVKIPYVRMRHADAECGMRQQMATVGTHRFVVRIRMRQTESPHVAIQNVSAHELDRKFQGVPLQKYTIQIPLNGPRGYNGQWYLNGI